MCSDLENELLQSCDETYFSEEMKKHSSILIGGKVFALCYPKDIEEIKSIIKTCQKFNFSFKVVGNSSNILYDDSFMNLCVISTIKLKGINVNDESCTMTIMAGEMLANCYFVSQKLGYSGFERLSLIPGTIGAGAIINAGAYGKSLSDIIKSVLVMTEFGEMITIQNEKLCYGYRSSMLQHSGLIVIHVEVQLERLSKNIINSIEIECKKKRLESQPLLPSLGSVFKKIEENLSAGQIIDRAGLKGLKIGGLEISEVHANFIVNRGNGTAKEFKHLVDLIKCTVKNKYNIDLVREVEYITKENT